MSELQFPKDPIVGQEYDFAPYKYYWDGVKWKTKGIGYNPVNDLRNELEPRISNNESKVFESLRRSYADAGLTLVDGSFETGGTLSSDTDVLLHNVTAKAYAWTGVFPHVAAPGTDPASVAGYVPRTDTALRSELAAVGSQVLIGGVKADTIAANISSGSFKNKIVDGRFDFWYEETDQTSSGYGSDTMWANVHVGSSAWHSQRGLSLTYGDLPCVENPSARYASRTNVTSVTGAGNYVRKVTKIESVRTLSGKKATLSFYAKADSSKFLGISLEQMFGTGEPPPAVPTVTVVSTKLQITSNWVRYSIPLDIPSVAGMNLGGNRDDCLVLTFGFDQGTDFSAQMGDLGHQSGTFDIACVQLEEGEQATKFEELPMSISETLVGRYYETSYPYSYRVGFSGNVNGYRGFTHPKTTTIAYGAATQFRVQKRNTPTGNIITVTVFAPGNGKKNYVDSNGSVTAVSSVNNITSTGFSSISFADAPLAENYDVLFHYAADARL